MSGLVLARILPQHGRGLTVAEIETRLYQRGVKMEGARLAGLLYYLESYGMVEHNEDRYLQSDMPPEVKL